MFLMDENRMAEAIGFAFGLSTPGKPVQTLAPRIYFSPQTFLNRCGYYTNEFELILRSATNVTIHYTLDGSEPTEQSPLYSAPIPIRNCSGTPNSISMIPTGGAWQSPASNIFKINVVRARAFEASLLPVLTPQPPVIWSFRARNIHFQ